MAASALLAEALQPALAHECWQPDVDVADAVPKMVCAQLTDITGAVFDLRGVVTMFILCIFKSSRLSAANTKLKPLRKKCIAL